LLEVVEAAQERALAGARGADDAHDLARRDLQVDAAQHLEAPEVLVDRLGPHHRGPAHRAPEEGSGPIGGAGGGAWNVVRSRRSRWIGVSGSCLTEPRAKYRSR